MGVRVGDRASRTLLRANHLFAAAGAAAAAARGNNNCARVVAATAAVDAFLPAAAANPMAANPVATAPRHTHTHTHTRRGVELCAPSRE